MGTAKRERQKANRQQRLEQLAKQARQQKTKRFGTRVALLLGAVVAVVGGLYLISGGDDDKSISAGTTTLLVDTTVAGPTTTAPPKPENPGPVGEVTELKVTTLREGTGAGAVAGDQMEVHYLGLTSIDGVEFENSYEGGNPIPVTLGAGGVIDGWDQGLVGLKVGGQYQIDIPVDLAYGPDAAAQGRPPGALTFIVDIMSITPAAPVTS